MPERLPEEYFRPAKKREPLPGSAGAEREQADATWRNKTAPSKQHGVAIPVAVAGTIAALLLGFGLGRVTVPHEAATVKPTSATSAEATPQSASPEKTLGPYEGKTTELIIADAGGDCISGVTSGAIDLLDDNPEEGWKCYGPGTAEKIQFSVVGDGLPLVGVRITNGDISQGYRSYFQSRRILSVRWEFPDGSWVVQGLSANTTEPQELRFPPVASEGTITLTVLDSTAMTDKDPTYNFVYVSSVTFLGAAA